MKKVLINSLMILALISYIALGIGFIWVVAELISFLDTGKVFNWNALLFILYDIIGAIILTASVAFIAINKSNTTIEQIKESHKSKKNSNIEKK